MTDTNKEREDVELSRACVRAWDASGFTSNSMDAVHPMFSTAFELGYRASLAAEAEPVALDHIACIEDGELRYMTGRKAPAFDCELYAMPDGKCAPPLYLAAPAQAPAPGWMSVEKRLPDPGTPVLLDIGKKFPIRAMWAAKFTVVAVEHDADWGEYNEATDTYYCPEGWYEWNEHEETHWRVTATPRAWLALPLPAAPSSGKGG